MITINIKDKLAQKNMNKNQFAKQVQIGYPAACALYDGVTTRISFDTLEKICKVLECTPNDIITTDDPQLKRLMTYYSKVNEICNKE